MTENCSAKLRGILGAKARVYANDQDLECYESLNTRAADGTVLFVQNEHDGTHGNFLDASFAQILSNKAWRSRLAKPHSQLRALPEDRRARAKELDSSNSSDALLMNILAIIRYLTPQISCAILSA
jgi:hypothetical protein